MHTLLAINEWANPARPYGIGLFKSLANCNEVDVAMFLIDFLILGQTHAPEPLYPGPISFLSGLGLKSLNRRLKIKPIYWQCPGQLALGKADHSLDTL